MWGYVGLLVISVLLLAARSLRPVVHTVTAYELRRRYGGTESAAEVLRHAQLPSLFGLRRLASGFLLMMLAVLAVGLIGLWKGLALAIIAALLTEALSRIGLLQWCIKRLLGRFEPRLLAVAQRLSPVLRYFAGSSHAPPDAPFYSKDELREQIKHDRFVLSDAEKSLLGQSLAYSDARIGDIMTPSDDITGVEAGETLGPVTLDRLHKSGHRWFPVANEDHTEVVGVLDLNEAAGRRDTGTIGDVMRPDVFYLHEGMGMDQALHACLRTGSPLFIVVDDSCEVVGMVTMTDIFQQLLGRNPVSDFEQYDDIEAVAANTKENDYENTSERTGQ